MAGHPHTGFIYCQRRIRQHSQCRMRLCEISSAIRCTPLRFYPPVSLCPSGQHVDKMSNQETQFSEWIWSLERNDYYCWRSRSDGQTEFLWGKTQAIEISG